VRARFVVFAVLVLAACGSPSHASTSAPSTTTTVTVSPTTTASATTTTTTSRPHSTSAKFALVQSLTRAYPPAPNTPEPTFIWGYGDPLFCGSPRASETAEANAAEVHDGALANASVLRGQRVVIVGDSTACSLVPGFAAAAQASGFSLDQGVVFGCGVASGEITTTRNEAITPHSSRCPGMVDWDIPRALARAQPTLVIWSSVWEKSDLVVNGRTVVAGTPEWERVIMARMDTALARLTYGGAKVVMLTEPAPAPTTSGPQETSDPKADNDGYVRLNALLRRFQARHRGAVMVVDVAALVCPGGPPCPATVDGTQPRPDSRHLTPAASTWVARFVLGRLH